MRRGVTDRTLRRWLSTGKPRRVTRLIERDEAVALRVDELTAFSGAEAAALAELVAPPALFEQRVVTGVQHRVEAYGTTSTVIDLLGLGFHTGRVVLGDSEEQRRRPNDDPLGEQENG